MSFQQSPYIRFTFKTKQRIRDYFIKGGYLSPCSVAVWPDGFFSFHYLCIYKREKLANSMQNLLKLVTIFAKYKTKPHKITKDILVGAKGVKFRQMWSHWQRAAYSTCLNFKEASNKSYVNRNQANLLDSDQSKS